MCEQDDALGKPTRVWDGTNVYDLILGIHTFKLDETTNNIIVVVPPFFVNSIDTNFILLSKLTLS